MPIGKSIVRKKESIGWKEGIKMWTEVLENKGRNMIESISRLLSLIYIETKYLTQLDNY